MADELTDHDVVNTMLELGGNFVRHLALAWFAADPINQRRLKSAFADEWATYEELAVLKLKR